LVKTEDDLEKAGHHNHDESSFKEGSSYVFEPLLIKLRPVFEGNKDRNGPGNQKNRKVRGGMSGRPFKAKEKVHGNQQGNLSHQNCGI